MSRVMIIGATSAIAEAAARRFAQRGDSLYLLARRMDRLETMAADLEVRGAQSVRYAQLDIIDYDRHASVLDAGIEALGGVDIVLVAHGTLPDQKACEQDLQLLHRELSINATGTVMLLMYLARYFEQQGSGTLAVISSVAGDRGRQSNYVYGAAKGMVSLFMQGLRNRLAGAGVRVLTVKPGFVDTPMTAEFDKGFLWATPDAVAQGIVKAIDKGSDVVYLPGFWRLIMLVIKAIPEAIFKKLKL